MRVNDGAEAGALAFGSVQTVLSQGWGESAKPLLILQGIPTSPSSALPPSPQPFLP